MGCGTAATVLQDEADAAQGLRRQKTYCQSIPRVYSGPVSYTHLTLPTIYSV